MIWAMILIQIQHYILKGICFNLFRIGGVAGASPLEGVAEDRAAG